jgi:CRP-like cAMP-binding protein
LSLEIHRLPSAPSAGRSDTRPKNQLLRALPAADFERLRPHLKTIPTRVKQVFYEQGEPLGYVYFPNGGVLSITTVLETGTMVETATVGSEGMVGIEAFFGTDPIAPGMTMMQVPDTNAERLSVVAFREELARGGALSILMGRYAQTTIKQMMQSTACNALHHVTERCPRWLLMTHDRVEGDSFQLSQEFLAVMLGVRRQTVSLVANTLQKAGLITYRHGYLTVLDRVGLEAASCECYATIRRHGDARRA